MAFRSGDKVPLVERERVGGALDGPPAFFREVHLLEADLDSIFASEILKPEICDTEPAHDVIAMWELSLQSFGSVT